MQIKIQSVMDGQELLSYFVAKNKENNIDIAHKSGSNPSQTKILVTNKNGEDVEISPDKIKIVYSNS